MEQRMELILMEREILRLTNTILILKSQFKEKVEPLLVDHDFDQQYNLVPKNGRLSDGEVK